MKLLTAPQRRLLVANHHKMQEHPDLDLRPVVKLFTPDANAIWLLTELDPETEIAFGFCDLGIGCPEFGSVSLAELESIRGPLGLRVERDRFFDPDRTISEYAREASAAGGIHV